MQMSIQTPSVDILTLSLPPPHFLLGTISAHPNIPTSPLPSNWTRPVESYSRCLRTVNMSTILQIMLMTTVLKSRQTTRNFSFPLLLTQAYQFLSTPPLLDKSNLVNPLLGVLSFNPSCVNYLSRCIHISRVQKEQGNSSMPLCDVYFSCPSGNRVYGYRLGLSVKRCLHSYSQEGSSCQLSLT